MAPPSASTSTATPAAAPSTTARPGGRSAELRDGRRGGLLVEEGRSHYALTCPSHRGLDALRSLRGSSPGGEESLGEGGVDLSDPAQRWTGCRGQAKTT